MTQRSGAGEMGERVVRAVPDALKRAGRIVVVAVAVLSAGACVVGLFILEIARPVIGIPIVVALTCVGGAWALTGGGRRWS